MNERESLVGEMCCQSQRADAAERETARLAEVLRHEHATLEGALARCDAAERTARAAREVWRVVDRRHYGRMPDEVQAAMDMLAVTLREMSPDVPLRARGGDRG